MAYKLNGGFRSSQKEKPDSYGLDTAGTLSDVVLLRKINILYE